ncbi:MAG: CDP-diacylglycerol--glycerol-3-phosphate 3-phosphatidyltransferase [Puniceicoccales bacterium]|jgi:CDP-diacylglycerol--glycerol-3-phosphate 3-phosphatidyltransferase|nr:CDP-diacylglycerol--glycerol-3-phosphate 3-phosphatidyltransferase [Puniceicoccales bacterium]
MLRQLPNLMTASRVPCLFVIAMLVAWGARWAPTLALLVFLLAAVTDYLDGWLARRLGVVSNFGKLMDALTDKILNVGLLIFLLVYPAGQPLLPAYCVFFVVVILVRELLITGLRLVAASSRLVLAAERSGKIKTVLQIFAIAALLLVLAARQDWGWEPALVEKIHIGALATFGAATLVTVTSGTVYLVKYWRVFVGEPTVTPPQTRD